MPGRPAHRAKGVAQARPDSRAEPALARPLSGHAVLGLDRGPQAIWPSIVLGRERDSEAIWGGSYMVRERQVTSYIIFLIPYSYFQSEVLQSESFWKIGC